MGVGGGEEGGQAGGGGREGQWKLSTVPSPLHPEDSCMA